MVMTQEEKRTKWREYYHKTHPRKEPRTFFHQGLQRVVTTDNNGRAFAIFWSKQMLDLLRQHFPTTLNDELAGMLGVSKSALARKARELELKKDPDWLHAVYEERRIMAHVVAKRLGYPGRIQKGEHRSPSTEFKKLSTEFNSLNTSDNEK